MFALCMGTSAPAASPPGFTRLSLERMRGEWVLLHGKHDCLPHVQAPLGQPGLGDFVQEHAAHFEGLLHAC